MKKTLALTVVALAFSAQAASAIVIDNFGTTSQLDILGVGFATQTVAAPSAIGGNRLERIDVATGTGRAAIDINSNFPNALAVSSESGIDASFRVAYGTTAPLNADFSGELGLLVRLLSTDIGSATNTVRIDSAGSQSVATFTIPSLVGQFGGPAAPVDVFVPFSSFVGSLTTSDVDTITYNINPPALGDYAVRLLGTYVPEPGMMGLFAPATLLIARRRKA